MVAATSPEFVRQITDKYGSRELLVLGDRRLTYSQADVESSAVARAMLSCGIGKGTRVGVLLPNGPDFLVLWLAATRIGALVVPLSTFYKARELAYVLRHADVAVLFTAAQLASHDYLARLEECAPSLRGSKPEALYLPELPYLRRVYVLGHNDRAWACAYEQLTAATQSSIDQTFLEAVEGCVTPSDAMTIIYSSGSAADPKGAVHTHATVISHAGNLSDLRDIETDDRCFSPMPFFWVGGLVFTLYCVMHKGACLVTEPAFHPETTLQLLERERVTHVAGWPHYGKAMLEHPSFKERDLRALRAGNIYAILPEAVRPHDVELRSNGLGMTETCGPHSLGRMDVDLPEPLRGSFGTAVGDIERKIVDPETGVMLPYGSVGELCVRGSSLMRELYKVGRERTFDADGFYHTGDLCYLLENGHLFFKGRRGDMIKTAGANVVPREIEALLEAQAEVQSAVVVGVPDNDREETVTAVVVMKAGYTVDKKTLLGRLKLELSAYKIPRRIMFVAATDIPMTSSGKVDRRKLIAQLSAATG